MASDSASIRSWSGFGTFFSGLSIARLTSGIQQFVQAVSRDPAHFARDLADSSSTPVSLFGDCGRLVIPDHRREHRAHGERLLDVSGRTLGIGFQTLDQALV